jgi:hypothetical protein
MWAIIIIKEALYALDRMEREPSDFEANVLETVTRQIQAGRLPSPKQHRILCEMIEKYLDDPALLKALQEEAPYVRQS